MKAEILLPWLTSLHFESNGFECVWLPHETFILILDCAVEDSTGDE